jgi:hypothetical protein
MIVCVCIESGIGLNVDKCWLSVVPQSLLQSAPYWNLVTAGYVSISSASHKHLISTNDGKKTTNKYIVHISQECVRMYLV